MSKDEAPTTAAEIRSLAEEAEAEAEEAEALAAAARARARAIQLRRQAELIETEPEDEGIEPDTAEATREATDSAAEFKVTVQVKGAEDEAVKETAAVAETKATGITETEPEETESAVEPESSYAEESPDEAIAESDTETSSADDAAEQPVRRWRVRPGRPRWSTVAASVAILAILAALSGNAYMIYLHHKAERDRQRVAEFAKAAGQGIINLTSLDFNDAKKGVQLILDNATGEFKDDFTKTADQYVKTVEEIKVHSQGTIQATAVDRDTMTDDSAVVLVASTQEVTNAVGAKQEPRSYRFIVTVKRDGGQLKLSKLEFVP